MLSAKYIHINMDKNERPKLYTLPDTLPALYRPAAGTIYPARSIWYRVQTGAACKASGRVCAVPCMVCLAACAVQSVRVRWGLGLHRRGI